MKTNCKAAAEALRNQNQIAASIIAANPDRYPGVMQEWADVVLSTSEDEYPLLPRVVEGSVKGETWKLSCHACSRELEMRAGPTREERRCPQCQALLQIEWRPQAS